MLQALLVTFRESVEACLVIAVIAAYLRRTGRDRLLIGVRLGLGLSVLTCTGGALLWREVPNQPLYEGIAALVSAGLVGLLLWQMLHMGRQLKSEIEQRVERGAASPHAIAGVALVTALFITREGLEAVFFLGSQIFYSKLVDVGVGAALGITLGVALAVGWARFGVKLQLPVLLRVTAVFLALFLVQLLLYGVHELAESGVIEGSQAFHDATERFGPDGQIGHALSYSLLAAPLLYLFWARRGGRAAQPASA